MTRFNDTGVKLTKHQNNAALGVNILPDAEMRAYGFTDHVPEEWYLCRKVSEDGTTTFNPTTIRDCSNATRTTGTRGPWPTNANANTGS